jgi:hypothetical protein
MPFIDALMKAANLDINQAKTLVYYCIMTWSDKPRIRPILNINGETGTGKNAIMKQIFPWCKDAKWINARNKTEPQLRDDLADTITVFIEEADKTKQQALCENWYQQRYEDTGKVTYRRQVINNKHENINEQGSYSHFGYTILHTQNTFNSMEMGRRTLRINLFKNSNRQYIHTDGLNPYVLTQIANEVDWDTIIPQPVNNSARDVWLSLMRVGSQLNDTEFLKYAEEQITAKVEEDDDSKVFEPKGIVLGEIVPLYKDCLAHNAKHIAITEVTELLRKRDYGHNEKTVTQLARQLGFTIVKPQNKAHIKVESETKLKAIIDRAEVSQYFDEKIDTELKCKRISF